MSATMRQGVAALLVRKTEEGRAKARRSIEAWQDAIGAVQKSEKMAECKINFATNQIDGPRQAAAQVDTANYVLAVHLANKSTAERSAAISTATATLQEQISRLELAEYHTQGEVRSAVKERDSAIAELKSKRDSGSLEFHEKRPLWLRVRLKKDPADTLTILISVALGVAFFNADFSFDTLSTNGAMNFIRLVCSVVVFFGSLTVVGKLMGWLREAQLDASVGFARAARERAFQKASQAAEKRLLEVMSEFEEGLRHAKAQRTKVEGALRGSSPKWQRAVSRMTKTMGQNAPTRRWRGTPRKKRGAPQSGSLRVNGGQRAYQDRADSRKMRCVRAGRSRGAHTLR